MYDRGIALPTTDRRPLGGSPPMTPMTNLLTAVDRHLTDMNETVERYCGSVLDTAHRYRRELWVISLLTLVIGDVGTTITGLSIGLSEINPHMAVINSMHPILAGLYVASWKLAGYVMLGVLARLITWSGYDGLYAYIYLGLLVWTVQGIWITAHNGLEILAVLG